MAELELDPERRPTVIADDLAITYRLLATGRREKAGTGSLLKRRMGTRRMREVHALKGISFVAYEGDAIGVVGRNGSGKSTLLRAISGLVPPSSGAIYAEGEPALLGVNAALINDLSGERNVVLGALALGLTPEQVAAEYDGIVDFAGVGEFIDLPMATYSSGMAAKLRFSIATVTQQRVLLIDEALATGDRSFRKKSEERIASLREQAGTVFLVSHSLSVIQHSCNRTIWLDGGVLKMDGPTEEVVAAYTESEDARGGAPSGKGAGAKAKARKDPDIDAATAPAGG
jgi:teichoic acid transport system ATP-binding protein